MLYKAIQLAKKLHQGQVRKYTNEPFINHPMRVMRQLALLLDEDCEYILAAAVLHDTLEDTDITYEEIKQQFNYQIADIVKELTNVEDKTEIRSVRKRKNTERLTKVSYEAKIIKLADRLDNIKSVLYYGQSEYVQKYIQETQDLLFAIGGAEPNLVERINNEIFAYYGNKSGMG